jgi:hypothetical protein
VPGEIAPVNGRLLAGLQRLSTFQHEGGMFSIWCGGTPGTDITARVAHRLLGLRGLPFDQSEAMLDQAKSALLGLNYQDNALLSLDRAFQADLVATEDAVAYYFAGNGRRDEALTFLRQNVQHEGNRVYWRARSAWGGPLEVTADAARVMADADDELFRPAFTFVTSKLIDGRLYSTADTRALVELLASLQVDPAARAVIDGQETPLSQQTIGQEVTALSDNLIVRVEATIEINHLEPRADFQFAVEPTKKKLKLGERTQITITPQESTIAPLARIFLPGNLAWLKGGANAQTAYLPIEQSKLTVDVVAVRPGRGKLYVSVHDMYDADKIGTIPGIEIQVT